MRPGSCRRHPLSLPVPHHSMRQAITTALPIALALILLPTLAFASPPDPSWVAGFYDGADGDDIVSLVYETSGATAPAPSHLGPLPCLLEISPEAIIRYVPDRHFTHGPRSPPVLGSPEFVSVFNSLPPPTSFSEAPVIRPSLVTLTEMIKLQRRTFDVAKRRDIVYDIERYLSEQAYYLYPSPSAKVVGAWEPYVKNYMPEHRQRLRRTHDGGLARQMTRVARRIP